MSDKVKAKRGRDTETEEDLQIDEETTEKVEKIQDEIEKIEREKELKSLKNHHNFETQKSPFLSQRAEILKTIPHFWENVLASHPLIWPYLQEKNTRDVFQTLQDVSIEDILDEGKNRSGFKITLTFGNNEFFTNQSLDITLTHPLIQNDDPTGDFYAQESAVIHWKPGKNIIEKVTKKKEKGKDDDNEELTFFSLFSADPNEPYVRGSPAPSLTVFSEIRNTIFFDPVEFLQTKLANDPEELEELEIDDDGNDADDEGIGGDDDDDEGDDDAAKKTQKNEDK